MGPIQSALLASGMVACVVAIGCDGRVNPDGADASAPVVDGGRIDGGRTSGPVLLDGIERFPPSPRLVRAACDGFTQQYTYDDSGRIIGWDYPTYDSSGEVIQHVTFDYADGRLSEVHAGSDTVVPHYDGERFVGSTIQFVTDSSGPVTVDSTLSFVDGRFDALLVAYQLAELHVSLRAAISYGSNGLVERVTYDATESPYERTIEHDFLYNGATGRIDRIIGTFPTAEPPSTAFRLEIEYDAAWRVAQVQHWSSDVLQSTYLFSYNSDGLLGRIESIGSTDTLPGVCDLFYEDGTTPTVQFSWSNLVTLRGELSPFVNLSEFNLFHIGPSLTTAPSFTQTW